MPDLHTRAVKAGYLCIVPRLSGKTAMPAGRDTRGKKDYFSFFRVRFSPKPFTSQEAPQDSAFGSTTR
jgi:hypothetical protein